MRKNVGYKLSYKMTKSTFMTLFLIAVASTDKKIMFSFFLFTCLMLPVRFFLKFWGQDKRFDQKYTMSGNYPFFQWSRFLEFSNSENSVGDSKQRGLMDQARNVTAIFKNFGSKVHSISSMASLALMGL